MSALYEFGLSVERDVLRGAAVNRRQRGIAAHVGFQVGVARSHVERREGVSPAVERQQRGRRVQVETRQVVVAAIQPHQSPHAVEIERRERIIPAVESFEVGAGRKVELREVVAPAVEFPQVEKLPDVGQRRDAPLRTLHAPDTLRLVARNTPVAVHVELFEAVSLERLVVKCEVNVLVLLVAVVLGKAAGRAEQNEQDGEGAHHRQRQMLTSSSELSVSDASSSPP